MEHIVFICYANQDQEIADAVCQKLEASGIPCWIAPRNVMYGEEWDEAIMKALTQTRFVVLVFSASSNDSKYCKNEIRTAFDAKKEIIPLLTDDTMPRGAMGLYLAGIQWLNAQKRPIEPYLNRLVEEVKKHIAQAKEREAIAAREKARKEEEERKARETAEKARQRAEEAARDKERREAEAASARQEAEDTKKAKEAAEKTRKEIEEAVKEKERQEADAAKARKEAEEAKKAREAAEKARQEAEAARKEKALQEAETTRARQEAKQAKKAAQTAEKALKKKVKVPAAAPASGEKKKHKVRNAWLVTGVLAVVIAAVAIPLLMSSHNKPGTTNNPTDTLAQTSAITNTPTESPTSSPTATPTTTAAENQLGINPLDYVALSFYPAQLDRTSVSGTYIFKAVISGNITCIQDIPINIHSVTLVPEVVAKNPDNGSSVNLVPGSDIVSDYIPSRQGEIVTFTHGLVLNFPDKTAPATYQIWMRIIKIKVNTDLGDYLSDYTQSAEWYSLGTIAYTQ